MCVVCQAYGWLGEVMDGGGGWYVFETKPWGYADMSGNSGALQECEVIH